MSSHDPQAVQEIRDDIDERSSGEASRSAEELAQDAQRRHAEAQAAHADPAKLFTQLVWMPTIGGQPLPDNPEDGSTGWDTMKNPHTVAMVTAAEKTGEPLFCFRARDFFSIQVIAFYASIVEQYGPDDAHFHNNIVDALGEFKEWQKDHIAEVRYPD